MHGIGNTLYTMPVNFDCFTFLKIFTCDNMGLKLNEYNIMPLIKNHISLNDLLNSKGIALSKD